MIITFCSNPLWNAESIRKTYFIVYFLIDAYLRLRNRNICDDMLIFVINLT